MKRIVVFGATGSIGAYLTDYFNVQIDKSKYEIVAIGRKKTDFFLNLGVEYYRVDISKGSDFECLPTEDIYAVVNLAGVLPAHLENYNPFTYIDTNIIGSINILEYARKNRADRILFSQTWSDQAGWWGKEDILSPSLPRKLPYTGDHAFYAITKSMVVESMEYYRQQYGLKSFVFRLPNVYMYHPDKYYYVDGNKRITAYRYIIEQAIKGEPIEMWGNPEAFKDVLYVKDLCQMMFKALFVDIDGGTYNAGTGVRTTLKEQIEGIITVFSPKENKSVIVEKPDKEGFVSFVMDISNAVTDLRYKPQYTYLNYLNDYKNEMELKRFDDMWQSKLV